MKRILLVLFLLILNFDYSYALDRCQDYIIDVKNQHIRYFGPTYPWWYGLGQLTQESTCRPNLTAFDGGQGIAQFMPATAAGVNKQLGERLNPYNPHDAIRMQAYYMSTVHKQNNFEGRPLWLTYQGYNGGFKLLRNENKRAGNSNWQDMKNQCRRNKVKLPKGRILDLCEVNYDYSKKIYKYGNPYRSGNDEMRYW